MTTSSDKPCRVCGVREDACACRDPDLWITEMWQFRCEQLANEVDRLREELAIWKSVFPDIAPEQVVPERSALLAETERLRQQVTQRGARMQIMREWLVFQNSWGHFAANHNAADWFDADGAPM